jgi:predicted RNA methylase
VSKINKKLMGQFFTPPQIADRLVQLLEQQVGFALDLGCGRGQLGESILKHFPLARYVGIEKDREHFNHCANLLTGQTIICADVLEEKALSLISDFMPADTVVGNPPFLEIPISNHLVIEIKDAIPNFLSSGHKMRSEMLFFAKSLKQLKIGGQASFILPKTFFISEQYRYFREHIIDNFSNISLFELPSRIFSGAEVSTCILYFNYRKTKNQQLTLGSIDANGDIENYLKIDSAAAVTRMDFSYHRLMSESGIRIEETETIGSIGGLIHRGNMSRNELVRKSVPHFHTTSFPINEIEISLDDDVKDGIRFGQEGDILLARVGTRCLDRQVVVTAGKRAITDCIYTIKLPETDIDTVIASLSSKYGKLWRQINAKGSCAKYLTKESLLNMPLFN